MGWSVQVLPPGPSLTRALAEHVLGALPASGGVADGSGVLVVVPAARARRSFERHLSSLARERGLAVVTPATLTPGELAGRFVVPTAPRLAGLGVRASWRAALGVARATEVLFPHVAEGQRPDDASVEALAGRVMRLHREVASAGLTFREVRDREFSVRQDPAGDRWAALAALESERTRLLHEAGVVDPASEACDAAHAGRVRAGSVSRAFVLLADPEPVHRLLLRALAGQGVEVAVTIHAGADALPAPCDPEGFPEHVPWSRARIDVGQHRVAVATSPADQAAAVVEWIASLPAPRRAEEIGIAVPDPQVAAEVASLLPSWGVRVAPPPGRTAAHSAVGMLLAAIGGWAGSRSCEALKALAGHPDMERRLGRRGGLSPTEVVAEFVASSGARSVPADLGHPALGKVRPLVEEIDRLLDPVRRASGTREAGRALRSVLDALVRPATPAALESARAARESIAELEELPAGLAAGLDAAAAIRLVHERMASHALPAEPGDGGIELLGWLDAGIDDAPDLAITGMNEGIVPEGLVVDPWLPDSARERLGMPCARRRQARDAWILHGLLMRKRSLHLVAGRAAADGEPLRPSRLLLGLHGEALAARVAWIVDPASARASAARWSSVAPLHGSFGPRLVPEGGAPITTISVTSFRDWLVSPTLFRLRRDPRLRLDAPRDEAGELDAMEFGSLVHEALERWGRDEARRSEGGGAPETDPVRIEEALLAQLDAACAARFAPDLRGTFQVQLAIARERLRAFAPVQARWASSGWRIRHVELVFGVHQGAHPSPQVGGTGIRLTGRIDRVDEHPEHGFAALDYKTTAEPEDPEEAHRRPKGRWIDLQLPLYLLLLRSLGITVDPKRLGYVSLPSNPSLTGIRLARRWDDAFAAEAEREAVRIAGLVAAGDFTDASGWQPPPSDPFAAAWCVGMRGLAAGAAP